MTLLQADQQIEATITDSLASSGSEQRRPELSAFRRTFRHTDCSAISQSRMRRLTNDERNEIRPNR